MESFKFLKSKKLPGLIALVFFLVLLSIHQFGNAQQDPGINITGRVVEENGGPLPGVNIKVKGTIIGTITNANGAFQFKVPDDDAVLVISYVGFLTQEIPVGTQRDFSIILTESFEALEELVVVGYGTQRKGAVLASISTIDDEQISKSSSSTVSGALVGKMAGILFRQENAQPGVQTDISIRNMGTPMFVIDGIISSRSDFNMIDKNDIKSISILKDGSAAIYGVNASNGVLIVTTKRGEGLQKSKVSINTYRGLQSWFRFPELANAYEYQRAIYESMVISNTFSGDVEAAREELENWRLGTYDPENGMDFRGYDYSQYARNNAPMTYINASATGGNEKINYYVSMARLGQDAVFEEFNFNRNNFQANIDFHITDRFKIGTSMNGRIENRNNPSLPGNAYNRAQLSLYNNLPITRPYANDNPLYPNKLQTNTANPATMSKEYSGHYENIQKVFQGTWDLEYTSPIEGLTATALFSYYTAGTEAEDFLKSYSTYIYNPQTDAYNVAYTNNNTYLVKRFANNTRNTYQFKLNYKNTFGDHEIGGVLAAEAQRSIYKSLQNREAPIVTNFITMFPNIQDVANREIKDAYKNTSTAGFIGRVTYGYKNKFLFEALARYDGSWRFPEGRRWGLFPSVMAGYRISEEDFWKDSQIGNIMNNLKLRFSYGQMGDANLGGAYPDFAYIPGYSYNSGYGATISSDPLNSITGTPTTGAVPNVPITNITWIHTTMYNAGIDMGFLRNRLMAEFDAFMRKRDGLPASRADVQLPVEVGFDAPPENLDSDKLYGIDGFINWRDKAGEFNYNVGINATLARKMIGERYGDRPGNSWQEYRFGGENRWHNAASSAQAWVSEVTGQFMTQYEIDHSLIEVDANGNRNVLPGDLMYNDLDGDGLMTDYDRRVLGYEYNRATGQLPLLTFGINLGFEWKGIDLSMDLAGGSMQTFVYDGVQKWPFHFGNSPAYILNERWHHEDIFDPFSPWVEGDYPALRRNDPWGTSGGNYRRWNSFYTTNVTYLRLRNLELGYNFPEDWTRKVNIQNLRLYLMGTNLFSLDNIAYRGMDPEVNEKDGYDYPQHKVITIGAKLTF